MYLHQPTVQLLILGAALAALSACAISTTITPPQSTRPQSPKTSTKPSSDTTTPKDVPHPSTLQSWRFSTKPGVRTYQLAITSRIQSSNSIEVISTQALRAHIKTSIIEQPTDFGIIATIDSVQIIEKQLITDHDSTISLPTFTIETTWTPGQSLLDSTAIQVCESQETQLRLKLRDLFPLIPATLLYTNSSWTDSTVVLACQGTIPISVTSKSIYHITGDTVILGQTALHIIRQDTITTSGVGVLQFHNMKILGYGTATSHIYINISNQHLEKSVTNQILTWSITSSGQTQQIYQHSQQLLTKLR